MGFQNHNQRALDSIILLTASTNTEKDQEPMFHFSELTEQPLKLQVPHL